MLTDERVDRSDFTLISHIPSALMLMNSDGIAGLLNPPVRLSFPTFSHSMNNLLIKLQLLDELLELAWTESPVGSSQLLVECLP